MAQGLKSLSHRHKDLSLHPQNLYKNLAWRSMATTSSLAYTMDGDSRFPKLTGQAALDKSMTFRLSKRYCLKSIDCRADEAVW